MKFLSLLLLTLVVQSILYQNTIGQASRVYYSQFLTSPSFGYFAACQLDGSSNSTLVSGVNIRSIAIDWNSTPQKIYVAQGSKIKRYDIDGNNPTDIVTAQADVYDLELDLLHRKVYWLVNTYSDDTLKCADMDGLNQNIEILYTSTTDVSVYWGLALDVPNSYIYWTVRGSNVSNCRLYRMHFDQTGFSALISGSPLDNPHDIEYYNGYIYWGNVEGLVRATASGSGVTTIVSGAQINFLSIDGTNERFYWTDASAEKLLRADLNGTNQIDVITGVSAISGVDVDYNPAALPVELNSLKAANMGNSIILTWQTATEVNNYGFEVERSLNLQGLANGKQASNLGGFTSIGFVEGYGNSNSQKEYSFIDETPPAGTIQYRLKQIDIDGSYSYSDIVNVTYSLQPSTFELYQNYPNPFNPSTVISWQLAVGSKVQLKILNVLGQEIAVLVDEYQNAGIHHSTFSTQQYSLPGGVYFYQLSTDEFQSTKKFVLLK